MLEPETKSSPAREVAHKSKGCLAVVVALVVLVVGGYFAYDRGGAWLSSIGKVPDYTNPAGTGPAVVTIPQGAPLQQIGAILVQSDVIASEKAWDRALRLEQRDTTVQAGRYAMRTHLPAAEALKRLLNPSQYRIKSQFTVPEGLRLSQQIDLLAKQTKINRAAYVAALKKPASLGLPSYAKGNAEGFLFPETYELTGGANATAVLRQMVNEYNQVAANMDLTGGASRLHRSPRDIVIVASIIEREVRLEEDRGKVARVLYNRLAAHQPLQLNSTVLYAAHRTTPIPQPGDLKNASPYNTYVHKGLPPGPISAPGKASLEAAANPTAGKWLYFVTVNCDTGETRFSDNAAQFAKDEADYHNRPGNAGKC